MNHQPTEESDVDINGAIAALQEGDYDRMSGIAHHWDEAYNRSHQTTERYLIERLQHDSHFRAYQKPQLIQDIERFVETIFNKIPKFSSKIIFSISGLEWLYKQWVEQQHRLEMYLAIQS